MANTPEWKTDATDQVMRVLYQAGIAVSAGSIAVNLNELVEEPPSRERIEEALDGMDSANMVRVLADEYYALTEHGRDYVDHEIEKQGIGFIE